ncbi:hypothetical protein AAC387_Pa07g3375 [Persea americana]
MENLWQDPLLFTDVSWQKPHLETMEMEKTGSPLCDNVIQNDSWEEQSLGTEETAKTDDTIQDNTPQCNNSVFGFSLTSPDLVICTGSPEIPRNDFEETPDLIKKACRRNLITSVELSLENGISGFQNEENLSATTAALFPEVPASNENRSLEPSLELPLILEVPKQTERHELPETSLPVISINVGGMDGTASLGGVGFQEDVFFMGGDVIKTEARIGDGEGLELYQSARFGNFSYKFQSLVAGNYAIDLHLAEIIFTEGPPGMRIFNVFIQEEKVVEGIDIYAQVGSNRPLVLSDLKAVVMGEEGLSIRFEGIIGHPLICGISIRRDTSTGKTLQRQVADHNTSIHLQDSSCQMGEQEQLDEECSYCNCNTGREARKLKRDYDLLYKEQTETKRALEEFKRENELKSKECHQAWMSLQELQNELMRKSMHVGSLAYAVEGQVKEKSRWFSSLHALSKKFKSLKIQHLKLSEEALQCRKCLTDVTQMAEAIQSSMNQRANLEREHDDLKLKFIEGAKERKELYNKVLELKGNIRVFCRCRPLNAEETATGASAAIDFESAKDGELVVKASGAPKKVFKFDCVFSPQADQDDVFKDTAPFVTSVLDGFNVCIFAYGQTGTGKTFTMEGTEEARGVNYRTLEELFRIIRERHGLFRYEISVSVLEVYNEQIRDLLASASQPGVAAKRLEIRQAAEGAHHVLGVVEAHVSNMNEVWEVLKTGSNARAVGSTNANEHSSRSHCIHCVMVKGENMMNGECTRSKLWLVDLAGSERIAKTEVQGERLKETQNINKSLSALGDVISALATKSPHIPFRNSKLTHLLQDSLGGDSKTLMFVQISPSENDVNETLCSLNFASRVRGIELGPAKKQYDINEISKYKQMAEKAKQDIKCKEGHMKRMEDMIHGLESKMKAKDMNNRNLQDKIKELESQLLIERKLARQHVDTKIAEQHQQQEQYTSMKPPLSNRQPGNHKNEAEPLMKDLVNVLRPLTLTENNNNNNKPLFPSAMTDDSFLTYDTEQKENTPEISEEQPLPRRTGRASICTTARRIPVVPAPRRNSLIPFPATATLTPLQPLHLPLPFDPIKEEIDDQGEKNCLELTPRNLKASKSSKKISSILRRSVQKRVYISPLHQHMRRGGPHGAMEKVRVSIGSRGRLAQRVLVGNANRGAKDVVQQKQQQKEKERGWNHGTAVKGIF